MPAFLSRRALLATTLAAPLAAPALRRAHGAGQAADAAARISLLHLNDFHAKHEGLQASGAACRADRPCLGGSARLATGWSALDAEARAEGRPALRLDAGDQFTGSLFHTAHHGKAEAAVQRATGCQAMALGNHEFDGGPERLAAYAEWVDFPLLSANLDTRNEPRLAGKIRSHAVFRHGGARIGLIGLTTETTPEASSPGPTVAFTDAREAALRAIAAIRAEGPATIVLLSHLGYLPDQQLAAAVPGVDLIVGAHSHTLLANDLPEREGPSPTMIDGPDRPVRIVQVGAYGRWLGRLDLDLAADGQVLAHGGRVLPVTPALEEDAQVAALVADYGKPLAEWRARPVGRSPETLSNNNCRKGECALGNVIAEAMLAAVPHAEVAVTNGGGLRAGLPDGQVTLGNVLEVLPFGNTLATLVIRGGDLKEALEIGLSRYQENGGGFPQVAGLRYRFDPDAPVGQRVREVSVRDGDRFRPLEPERAYRVVTNNFTRRGGDGYTPFKDKALDAYDNGPPLEDVAAAYIAADGAFRTRLDGRISRE
ncbi:bifunctional metallophosphatase/5'-nucleotidase [Roseomonas sp. M0104]|uniref:Bifunctional metallophosphatase/5'-nucleotidase n=1 Tax=Teichococcus coralli TaxID=2545983 RepID=A0A845BHM1_9PROT|nr:5'-nucleotidase C-terminal domain-containing protein [Pseudoroseomonas coralli]MXP62949.1 bifunctional metallophosphatase/5'-nucleotidase [Pseudoroseomonas coralli]